MNQFFFNGWNPVLRTLVVGVCAYVALIIILRISGKRTLSKMNAFDLVVTVALGSTLATILLSKDVALAQGVLGLALLIGLQYAVAWLNTRSRWFGRMVKSEPRLLLYRGEMLEDALRDERVVPAEVRSAVRAAGGGAVERVQAVVLETDGTFSVIESSDPESDLTALRGVRGRAPFEDREEMP